MKHNHIFLLILTLLLAGCNSSVISPTPTQPEPTYTFTPTSTITPPPTATLTIVPILTDMSCKPSSNPFEKPSTMSDIDYAVSLFPNITITRVCTFTGHIARGQIYKHQIMKNLNFYLCPSGIFSNEHDEGWSIFINDSRSKSCNFEEDFADFASIVTPPFHGNLTLDVFGWEFRNEENTTGANDRSFYVPQKERDFNFLFNRKDFEAVWHASRCDEWRMPDDCALATQTPAGSNTFIPRSRAHFTITEIELGNLIPHTS